MKEPVKPPGRQRFEKVVEWKDKDDLQEAYNIAMSEIARLRKLLEKKK